MRFELLIEVDLVAIRWLKAEFRALRLLAGLCLGNLKIGVKLIIYLIYNALKCTYPHQDAFHVALLVLKTLLKLYHQQLPLTRFLQKLSHDRTLIHFLVQFNICS